LKGKRELNLSQNESMDINHDDYKNINRVLCYILLFYIPMLYISYAIC
jgi:hypothetical protein